MATNAWSNSDRPSSRAPAHLPMATTFRGMFGWSTRAMSRSGARASDARKWMVLRSITADKVSLYPMPRDLPISNGNLMINFDHQYNIRDVYYPHVGQDNQTVGDVSFFGVWCDGVFAWIGDPSWEKRLVYEDDTL